jgi:DNA-binding CsgD family transcriptional regulator
MSTSQIELSSEQLFKAVARLPQLELDRFIAQVVKLRSPTEGHKLSRRESELLLKINQGIPAEIQRRYDDLIARRQNFALTPTEYEELLRLTNQIEMLDAQRIEYLSKLARLRKKPLTVVMDELGIQAPVYG